jgi:hypothetical protein
LNVDHPSGDDLGVGALVENLLVLAEAPITIADLFGEGRLPRFIFGIGLGGPN